MPDLDVSFMTADPMFADTVTVTRRTDSVTGKGRANPTASQVFQGVVGVVTQEPVDLKRDPDAQRMPRRIFFATAFMVQGPAVSGGVNYQPDVITWNGVDYLVTRVLPYSRFGGGTYEVEAESMTMTNPPQ